MLSQQEINEKRRIYEQASTIEGYLSAYEFDYPLRGENTLFFDFVQKISDSVVQMSLDATHFVYGRAYKSSETLDCIHVFETPEFSYSNVVGKVSCFGANPSEIVTSEEDSLIETTYKGGLVRILEEGLGTRAEFDRVVFVAGAGELNGTEGFVYRKYLQRLLNTKRSLPMAKGTCRQRVIRTLEEELCEDIKDSWFSIEYPYVREDKCEYWYSYQSPFSMPTVMSGGDSEARGQILREAISEMLTYYDKYNNEDFINFLLEETFKFAEIRGAYPSITGSKVLITIPTKYFDAIPRQEVDLSEYLKRFKGRVEKIIKFRTSEIEEQIKNLSEGMLEYNSTLGWARASNGVYGPLGYGKFSFSREVKNLSSFISRMTGFFKLNNRVFRRTNPDIVEIGIDSNNKILFVLLDDLSGPVPLRIGLSYYSTTEPLSLSRTINLIGKVKTINSNFQTTKNIDWKEFIESYIVPQPIIDTKKRNNDCEPNPLFPLKCCLENAFKDLYGSMDASSFALADIGDSLETAASDIFEKFRKYPLETNSYCGFGPLDLLPTKGEKSWIDRVLADSGFQDIIDAGGDLIEEFEDSSNLDGSPLDDVEAPIFSSVAESQREEEFALIAPALWECAKKDSEIVSDPYIREIVESISSFNGEDIDGDRVIEIFSKIDFKSIAKRALECGCKILERAEDQALRSEAARRRQNEINNLGIDSYGNARAIEEEMAGSKIMLYLSDLGIRGEDPASNLNYRTDLSSDHISDSDVPDVERDVLGFDAEGNFSAISLTHDVICKDICSAIPVLCSCLDFSLPELPDLPFAPFDIKGLFGYLISLLLELLIDIIIDFLFAMIKAFIDDLLECEFESQPETREAFNDLLQNSMNLDALADSRVRARLDSQSEFSVSDLLRPFLSDVPFVITPTEFCNLINGQPLARTLKTLEDLIISQHSALRPALDSTEKIKDLFVLLGDNLDDQGICRTLQQVSDATPNTTTAEHICNVTGENLIRRKLEIEGASPEQIADLLDEAKICKQKRIESIANLSKDISNDPKDFFKKFLPTMFSKPGEPGLIPRDPPELIEIIDKAVDRMLEPVLIAFNKESNSFPTSLIVVERDDEINEETGEVTEYRSKTIVAGGLKEDLVEKDNFKKSSFVETGYATSYDLTMSDFEVKRVKNSSNPYVSSNPNVNFEKNKMSVSMKYKLPLSSQCVGLERERDFFETQIIKTERDDTDNVLAANSFRVVGEKYLPDFVKNLFMQGSFEITGESSLQQEIFYNLLLGKLQELPEAQKEIIARFYRDSFFDRSTVACLYQTANLLSTSRFFDENNLRNLQISRDEFCVPPRNSMINLEDTAVKFKKSYQEDGVVNRHKERFSLSMIEGAVNTFIKSSVLEFILSGIFPFSKFSMEEVLDDGYAKLATKILLSDLENENDFAFKGKISLESFREIREVINNSSASRLRYVDSLNEWHSTFKSEFLRWCKISLLKRIENGEQFVDPFTKERIIVDLTDSAAKNSIIARPNTDRLSVTEYYFALKEWYESYFIFQLRYDSLSPEETVDWDSVSNREETKMTLINQSLRDFEEQNIPDFLLGQGQSVNGIDILEEGRGAPQEELTDDEFIEREKRFEETRYILFRFFEKYLKSLIPEDPDNNAKRNIILLSRIAQGTINENPLAELSFYDNFSTSLEAASLANIFGGVPIDVNKLLTGNDLDVTYKEQALHMLRFFNEVTTTYNCECVSLYDETEGITQGGNTREMKKVGYLEFLVREQIESSRFEVESYLGSEIESLEKVFFGLRGGNLDASNLEEFNESVDDVSIRLIDENQNREPYELSSTGLQPQLRTLSLGQFTGTEVPITVERYLTIKEKPGSFWINLSLFAGGSEATLPPELQDITRSQANFIISKFAPQNRTKATRYFYDLVEETEEYVVSYKNFFGWVSTIRAEELREQSLEELFWIEDSERNRFYFNYKLLFDDIKVGLRMNLVEMSQDLNNEMQEYSQREKDIIYDKTKAYFSVSNINLVPFAKHELDTSVDMISTRSTRLTLNDLIEYGILEQDDILDFDPVVTIRRQSGAIQGQESTTNYFWEEDFGVIDNFFGEIRSDRERFQVESISKDTTVSEFRNFVFSRASYRENYFNDFSSANPDSSYEQQILTSLAQAGVDGQYGRFDEVSEARSSYSLVTDITRYLLDYENILSVKAFSTLLKNERDVRTYEKEQNRDAPYQYFSSLGSIEAPLGPFWSYQGTHNGDRVFYSTPKLVLDYIRSRVPNSFLMTSHLGSSAYGSPQKDVLYHSLNGQTGEQTLLYNNHAILDKLKEMNLLLATQPEADIDSPQKLWRITDKIDENVFLNLFAEGDSWRRVVQSHTRNYISEPSNHRLWPVFGRWQKKYQVFFVSDKISGWQHSYATRSGPEGVDRIIQEYSSTPIMQNVTYRDILDITNLAKFSGSIMIQVSYEWEYYENYEQFFVPLGRTNGTRPNQAFKQIFRTGPVSRDTQIAASYDIKEELLFKQFNNRIYSLMSQIYDYHETSRSVANLEMLGEMMDMNYKIEYHPALLRELTRSHEYKLLNEYLFPTKRFVSIIGLYSMQKVIENMKSMGSFEETKFNAKMFFYTALSNFITDENGADAWWKMDMMNMMRLGLFELPEWMKYFMNPIQFSLSDFLTFIPEKLFDVLLGVDIVSIVLDGLCVLLPPFGRTCRDWLNIFSRKSWETDTDLGLIDDSYCGTPEQIELRKKQLRERERKASGSNYGIDDVLSNLFL